MTEKVVKKASNLSLSRLIFFILVLTGTLIYNQFYKREELYLYILILINLNLIFNKAKFKVHSLKNELTPNEKLYLSTLPDGYYKQENKEWLISNRKEFKHYKEYFMTIKDKLK